MATATRTWTRTPSATPTRARRNVPVKGRITYYSSALPVNAAAVQLSGAATTAAQTTALVETDEQGAFNLTAETESPWDIVPHKLGDTRHSITSLDAVYVLQAAIGQRRIWGTQACACDVSGNAQLTALDAALILQYRVGALAQFPVAARCVSDWGFVPDPATVPNQSVTSLHIGGDQCRPAGIRIDPLVDDAADQDFAAIAFGDCSGNWQPPTTSVAAQVAGAGGARPAVRVGPARRLRGGRIRLPLSVAGAPYHALDVDVRFDPARLRAGRVRALGAASRALLQAHVSEPGLLRVSLASGSAISADGTTSIIVELIGAGSSRAPVVVTAVVDDQAPAVTALAPALR